MENIIGLICGVCIGISSAELGHLLARASGTSEWKGGLAATVLCAGFAYVILFA